MAKKIFTVLLLLFILLPGSAFHDMLIVMFIIFIWRKELRQRLNAWWKYGYATLLTVTGCLTLLLMPRPFALPSDRARLVYFNDEGKRVAAPLHHWLFNLILPEETMCAIGSVVPLTPLRGMLPIGESILKDYDIELKSGSLLGIGSVYHNNDLALESPMSGVVPQGFKEMFGEHSRACYVVRPKNFDKEKAYPVLFFAHGYLGNWKLYPGLLRDITDHIVVCMSTEDLSGIFTNRHIREIKTLYLPMLADMGYKVDTDRLSIMGLSNGGSAIDCAYSSNPRMFKNLVYVSTGVNNYYRIPGKVMIIGGGVDHCAPSMERGMRRLKANGQKSAFLYDQEDTHLKLVSDRRNCLRFLREEL